MDDASAEKIAEGLEYEHRAQLFSDDQAALDNEIRRALRRLPSCDAWAISDKTACAMVLVGDALFMIEVLDNSRVVTRRQPLRPETLVLELEVDLPERGEAGSQVRSTHWRLLHWGALAPWLEITGRTQSYQDGREEKDRREQLAQAIASQVRWEIGGG
jgi:hypothetical protein